MSIPHESMRSIFDRALELAPGTERQNYLDAACAAAPGLRGRVEALLQAHRDAGSFLEEAAVGDLTIDKPSVPPFPAERPGTQIGPYKLVEEIGEGGMGIVYLAEQREPVERRVALKIIKPGMDSRQVIARFEIERRALALMDHPAIARVLDAGATDSGRPYFVMELVKGIPITAYCDQFNLTTRDRLELFTDVCRGVQHAHQKGIIHRDLKPTNVLVAMSDGRPVVKVIDFGVAKATGQRLTEHSVMTGLTQLVGTPLYMSPEQAEMGPLDVDTRSDVYSLGVLLYELLTGTTPFEKGRLMQVTDDELRRIIREEDPPKPSARLSTLSAEAVSTAAERQRTDSRRLCHVVRGDLDWIVMKALEKDRTRRYETANAFCRDIERYLHGEPVEACPPSAAYRFRKFARRNRATLATVALVAALLVLGTFVSTWQAIRATRAERLAGQRLIAETTARAEADRARDAEARQRKLAEAERAEAEKQRAAAEANLQKAKATVDKYFTAVSESKLLDVPGMQPLRKELLESALEFYENLALERPDDPTLLADLAVTYLRLSYIHIAFGRLDDSDKSVSQALDLIARLRRDYPDMDQYEPRLAGFWAGLRPMRAKPVQMWNNPLRAFQNLLRLEDTWKKLSEKYPANAAFLSDLTSIQATIGALLTEVGWKGGPAYWRRGAQYYRQALAIAERLSAEHPDTHTYRGNLALICQLLADNLGMQHQFDESRDLMRRAIELWNVLVEESPETPAYRWMLSNSLVQLGRRSHEQPAEAEACIRRGIDVAESLVRDFPDVSVYYEYLAIALDAQFALAAQQQDHELTAELLDTVERISAALRAPQVRWVWALRLRQIAEQRDCAQEARDALHALSLALSKQLVGEFPANPEYLEFAAHAYRRLGSAACSDGRLDEAQRHFEQAVAAFDKLCDDDSATHVGDVLRWRADTLALLADVLNKQGSVAEAIDTLGRAIDACGSLVTETPNNKQVRGMLIELLDRQARWLHAPRPQDAEAAMQDALSAVAGFAEDAPSRYAYTARLCTTYQWHLGQAERAEAAARDALAVAERAVPDGSPDVASVLRALADALVQTGRPAEAEPLARRSVEMLRCLVGEPDVSLGFSLLAHGRALAALARDAEAIETWFEGATMFKQLEHPDGLKWTVEAIVPVLDRLDDPAARESGKRRLEPLTEALKSD